MKKYKIENLNGVEVRFVRRSYVREGRYCSK